MECRNALASIASFQTTVITLSGFCWIVDSRNALASSASFQTNIETEVRIALQQWVVMPLRAVHHFRRIYDAVCHIDAGGCWVVMPLRAVHHFRPVCAGCTMARVLRLVVMPLRAVHHFRQDKDGALLLLGRMGVVMPLRAVHHFRR